MLLVVALIALLISILLPNMTRAREAARRIQCLTQQHMIAAGVVGYANENRGMIPTFKSWSTQFISSTPDGYVDSRPLLLGLTGSKETYYCPSHAVLKASDLSVGWNATAANVDAQVDRYMSYSPIGIWYQSTVSVTFAKTYTAKPAYPTPNVTKQGNKPVRLASASPDMAVTTDGQNSWYAGSWGLSFTYPGDGVWPEHPGYYSYYAYPHREAANAWAGGNTVFFDGSGRWANLSEILKKNLPYPHGAKWIMHYKRGVYEGAMFW